MLEIDLKTAVTVIHQTLDDWADRARGTDPKSPFFFFVGAGISHPPIPLASTVQAQCRTRAERYGHKPPRADCSPLESYSHWFERAHPNREGRQHFLRTLMENAVISEANFRLAHLLLDGRVATLAVTANFDDFLTRALVLFGERPIVCDSPYTVGRVSVESTDLQVLHVHGSFWAYDCCNLRGEIDERSHYSNARPATVRSRLDSVLHSHSPLVVGYSGWEGDVFMSALQNRLTGDLGTNLYWFCHRRENISALPKWLKNHPDVRFVIPETPSQPGADKSVAQSPSPGPSAGLNQSGSPPSAGEDAALSATEVFEKLIEELRLDPPPLTADPVSFFARHLKKSLVSDPGTIRQDNDKYAILSVIERLEKIAELEKQQGSHTLQSLQQMEAFRNAVRQADYPAALDQGSRMNLRELSVHQLRELITGIAESDFRPEGKWELQIALADFVASAADVLAQHGDLDIATSRSLATVLFRKAFSLAELDQSEDAITTYDELVRRFGESSDETLRRQAAGALINKGNRLVALDRGEEGIAVYDEVARRFGEAVESDLRQRVARGLLYKAWALTGLNRGEEAIAAYDELTRRFSEAVEPKLTETFALALFYRGGVLRVLGREEEAIAAYDDIVRRFGDATDPALRQQIATALVNKAWTLGSLRRYEEAIMACEEVVRHVGEAAELGLQEQCAIALVNLGWNLGELSRNEEAAAMYDEVLRRFGDAPELGLRESVAMALVNKGTALGRLKRSEEAIAAYDEALRRVGDSAEPELKHWADEAAALRVTLVEECGSTEVKPPDSSGLEPNHA